MKSFAITNEFLCSSSHACCSIRLERKERKTRNCYRQSTENLLLLVEVHIFSLRFMFASISRSAMFTLFCFTNSTANKVHMFCYYEHRPNFEKSFVYRTFCGLTNVHTKYIVYLLKCLTS